MAVQLHAGQQAGSGRRADGGPARDAGAAAGPVPAAFPRAARRAALAVCSALVAALAAATVILPPRLPPGPAPAHELLASWIVAQTDPGSAVDAPADVRAELAGDGVPAGRLRTARDALLVTRGACGPGQVLAGFGAGTGALCVTAPSVPDTGGSARVALGRQLATNPAVDARTGARDLLAGGRADPRALLLLAGLTAQGPVGVVDLPAVAGEAPGVPRHLLVLAGPSPAQLAWIHAQRPPYAPRVEPGPDTAP